MTHENGWRWKLFPNAAKAATDFTDFTKEKNHFSEIGEICGCFLFLKQAKGHTHGGILLCSGHRIQGATWIG